MKPKPPPPAGREEKSAPRGKSRGTRGDVDLDIRQAAKSNRRDSGFIERVHARKRDYVRYNGLGIVVGFQSVHKTMTGLLRSTQAEMLLLPPCM